MEMRAIILLSALLLSACLATTPTESQRYPMEIAAPGAPSDFPLQVGGYIRGKALSYAPGDQNVSVAYNHDDPVLQNAITLYFYPSPVSATELYEAEKQLVLNRHRNGALVQESVLALEKNGVSYTARNAVFSYREDFAGRRQDLFSQLILVELPDRFFKVRSSAPVDQAALAENSTIFLVNSVNWAY